MKREMVLLTVGGESKFYKAYKYKGWFIARYHTARKRYFVKGEAVHVGDFDTIADAVDFIEHGRIR